MPLPKAPIDEQQLLLESMAQEHGLAKPYLAPTPDFQHAADPTNLPVIPDANGPAEPPPPVMDPAKVLAARDSGDKTRLFAGLSRAADKIGSAFAGTKPDYGGSEALLALAGGPEKRLQEDFNLEQLAHKAQVHKATMDPASPMNRSRQSQLVQAFPHLAAKLGDQITKMTGPDIDRVVDLFSKDQTNELKSNKSMLDYFLGKQNADTARINSENKNDNQDARIRIAEEGNRIKREGMQGTMDRFKNTNLIKYDTRLKAVTPIIATMRYIDEKAPGALKGAAGSFNITELDRITRKLPGNFGSQFTEPDKAAIQSALELSKQYIYRPLTGATLTDAEKKDVDAIFQSATLADPTVQVAVLNMIRSQLAQQIRAVQGAYRTGPQAITPEMWKEYGKYGGVVSEDPLFSDLFPQSDAAPSPKKDGGAPTAVGKRRRPDGMWDVKYSDGSVKIVRLKDK